MLSIKIKKIDEQINLLTRKRNALIHDLRKECKHLKLVELDGNPPQRICFDCGAEEKGWQCGYHVLVMQGDTWEAPHKHKRAVVLKTTDSSVFARYRKGGFHGVGQSHPAFQDGGKVSYKILNEPGPVFLNQ